MRLDKNGEFLMMTAKQPNYPAEFNYHMLRYALNDFTQNILQLDSKQYNQVLNKAIKSYELESLVLTSAEANGVIISEQQLQTSIEQVSSRYQNETEFLQDLENNSLDEDSLRKALHRELLFDSVMQRVIAGNTTEISDIDVALFYELHLTRFSTAEKRLTRHILITINPDFPENTHQASLLKIHEIQAKLDGQASLFADFSKRFSECPSAMEGGKLGEVVQGQLYPELDEILFKMSENEISSVVKSEMGYHLLLCEKITPAKTISLVDASQRIREILQKRNEINCQKLWLAKLQNITPRME
jgi:peptidyl-prolyl cis-trans isomerase C